VLEIAGYNVDKIKNDLIYENESMRMLYN